MLYVVSTPIGNMKDITLRAVDTLKSCDYVLSEDTRETDKLFKEYNFSVPQLSYRDQNHSRMIEDIKSMLSQGLNLALVSDSGTPVISDPGFKLINDVISAGYEVKTIPGPSSITAALCIAGLPTDKFTFLGFLPKGKGQRSKLLTAYGQLDATLIIFESPYRVVSLLNEILANLGDRKCVVLAELTKLYERVYRGPVSNLVKELQKSPTRGEFIVMVAKKDY